MSESQSHRAKCHAYNQSAYGSLRTSWCEIRHSLRPRLEADPPSSIHSSRRRTIAVADTMVSYARPIYTSYRTEYMWRRRASTLLRLMVTGHHSTSTLPTSGMDGVRDQAPSATLLRSTVTQHQRRFMGVFPRSLEVVQVPHRAK